MVGCYIWYSEEATGQKRSPLSPLLAAADRAHHYIHLYSPERQQQQVKKAPNTQQKQTNKREEKNYAQIGQASEQCYHERTLKTSVNQR